MVASVLIALLSSSVVHTAPIDGSEPNPPKWPSSVFVFDASSDIQGAVNEAFSKNGGHNPPNNGQFSTDRYAFLFKPGQYNVDVPIGYYTSVYGLGASPNDVNFTSPRGVHSEEGDYSIGGALSSFWRSAENFLNSCTNKWNVGTGMMWAVSQGVSLRRVEVTQDLLLFQYEPPITAAGEASGGYMANVKVGGKTAGGSQQQWFARDSTLTGGFTGGVWNYVFTGVTGAPPDHCGNPVWNGKHHMPSGTASTNVPQTPVIAEKPFLTVDSTGKFSLRIPTVRHGTAGHDFDTNPPAVGFESVYVTQPSDSAAAINAKLAQGLHVVVSPGVYHLDEPLELNHPNQVLLGLGYATLVSAKQNAVIRVGDVDGVRVAGFLLQAGPPQGDQMAPALLQWGVSGKYAGSASNPGFIHDVFGRVGGPDGMYSNPVATELMLHIRSGHVVGDNMWLWRADHTAGGIPSTQSNRVDHGIVVDGDDVTMYGLAVEHTVQDLTLWNGERGRTYFYQSELPYGVNQSQFGNFTGYRVADKVKSHSGWGIGVYSFFRDHEVTVPSGIVCPPALESSFVHSVTVKLNGHGGISHVINDKGDAVTANVTSIGYVC